VWGVVSPSSPTLRHAVMYRWRCSGVEHRHTTNGTPRRFKTQLQTIRASRPLASRKGWMSIRAWWVMAAASSAQPAADSTRRFAMSTHASCHSETPGWLRAQARIREQAREALR